MAEDQGYYKDDGYLNMAITMNALLLGKKASTKAVGRIIDFLGIVISRSDNYDLLVMVDGDSYGLKELQETKFKKTAKLIYVMTADRRIINLHPLCFLQKFFDTYTISLEDFSIRDFICIVGNILGWKDMVELHPQKGEMTLRDFSKVAQSEPLRNLCDQAVKSFCHNLKHGLWTPFENSGKLFVKGPSTGTYVKFISDFTNQQFLPVCNMRLVECIDELAKWGSNSQQYPILESISDTVQDLLTTKLPKKYPNSQEEVRRVLDQIVVCVKNAERLESLGRRGDGGDFS